MTPDDLDVVLVRPARAVNVGVAARALANMGASRLTLVEPAADLADPALHRAAHGAETILDQARRVRSLDEAVAGSTLVVATTSRGSTEAWSPRSFPARADERRDGGRVAVVFGPERTGLTNRELALCHAEVRIPTHPAHGSLNLAQAVLILAYEVFLGASRAAAPPQPSRLDAGELEAVVQQLRGGLLAIGYLNPDNPDLVLTELRRMLARAAPTTREGTLLRGLGRQMSWAGLEIARARASRR